MHAPSAGMVSDPVYADLLKSGNGNVREEQAMRSTLHLALAASAIAALAATHSVAQSGRPDPYRPVKGLADGGGPFVPGGEWAARPAGPPASVYVDADGESIWAVIRCDETSPVPTGNGGRFGIDCLDKNNKIKNVDTIFKF